MLLVYETETLEQANAEVLRQIEEGLTHSREVIGQIDMIRRLLFTAGGPNPLRPRALLRAPSDF